MYLMQGMKERKPNTLLVRFKANSIKEETLMNVPYSIAQMHSLGSLKSLSLNIILTIESMVDCAFLSVPKLKMRWVMFDLLRTHLTT